MIIYFMRHGETDYNKQGLIQGRTDIPLNENGIAQAQKAADYFKAQQICFDRVYASPLIRAYRTAAIASGWEMDKIVTDERIQELAFGTAEGADFYTLPEGIMNLFKKPEAYEVPEGAESIEELKTRCQSFLDELVMLPDKDPSVKNVLVASHGAALRGIISCVEKSAIEVFWKKGLTNCTIVPIELKDGIYEMKDMIDPLKN